MSNASTAAIDAALNPPGVDLVQPKHEVGRQLGISTRQVDRFIHDGDLPIVELSPRRVGILQSDIDAFKRLRRIRRGAPAAVEAAQSEQA
jgi:predicted DNA-binding transcriptional regulator AlpA